MKAAEEIHLPKSLRQEFGGGLKEFIGSESSCFEGSDDEARFFTTQERQSLVLHLLHTLRAGPQDLHSLPGLKMVEGQAIIPKCLSAGIISQVGVTPTYIGLVVFRENTEYTVKLCKLNNLSLILRVGKEFMSRWKVIQLLTNLKFSKIVSYFKKTSCKKI